MKDITERRTRYRETAELVDLIDGLYDTKLFTMLHSVKMVIGDNRCTARNIAAVLRLA